MASTVAIVGGGYAGIAVASALDDELDVVLVEPSDAFVHNIAALRAVVDPAWPERIFLAYDNLLERGRVLRDRAVRVDGESVTLASGAQLSPDFVVLATGSSYPYPAKPGMIDSDAAKASLRGTQEQLTRAQSVLLLGAGPVGLEFAGEIKAAWPGKAVTVVDQADDILAGGYSEEFRAELRHQLTTLGVELVLGAALREVPAVPPAELIPFTVSVKTGRRIAADIWFRCHGVAPVSDYLAGDLAASRQPSGHVEVGDDLRLAGQRGVFAIGDLTAIPEQKTAKAAVMHAAVVADNIRTVVDGGVELASYTPADPAIVLPLGPRGGASYTPDRGVIDAETTTRLKSADLMVARYAEVLGVDGAISSDDVAMSSAADA